MRSPSRATCAAAITDERRYGLSLSAWLPLPTVSFLSRSHPICKIPDTSFASSSCRPIVVTIYGVGENFLLLEVDLL